MYHLGIRRGDVAARVVSVGDRGRATLVASFLSPLPGESAVRRVESKRGFVVHTGSFEGVPVSVVATGMGAPMMDFVVRECRACVDPERQMAFARLGTCGLLRPDLPVGAMVVASPGAVFVRRNPDAWAEEEEEEEEEEETPGTTTAAPRGADGDDFEPSSPPYALTKPAPADPELTRVLLERLRANLADAAKAAEARDDDDDEGREGYSGREVVYSVHEGLDVTADSFYSSQGRVGTSFDDRNADLLDRVVGEAPDAASLQMETFHLLDLARASGGSVVAAACAIGLANRRSNEFIAADRVEALERIGGASVLEALARIRLRGEENGRALAFDVVRASEPAPESEPESESEEAAVGERETTDAKKQSATRARASTFRIGLGGKNQPRRPYAYAFTDESATSESASGGSASGGSASGGSASEPSSASVSAPSTGPAPPAASSSRMNPFAYVASLVSAYSSRSRELAARMKSLGLAGFTAYGINNTVYYTLAFTAAWTLRGIPPESAATLGATFRAAGEVMALVWAGSQVTKLARFALAIAMAPKIDERMEAWGRETGWGKERTFATVTFGCFLGSAAFFAALIVAKGVAAR